MPDFFRDPNGEGELLHDIVLGDGIHIEARCEAALRRDVYPDNDDRRRPAGCYAIKCRHTGSGPERLGVARDDLGSGISELFRLVGVLEPQEKASSLLGLRAKDGRYNTPRGLLSR